MTHTSTATGPVAPPPSPPRRLVRRRDDRVIAGVASGAAHYLQVDPVVVRIAFVVLCLIGGVGLLLYLAAWLLMPDAATNIQEHGNGVRRDEPRFWIAVALIVVASALLADELWRPGLVWPLALIGIGLLLFHRPPVTASPGESFDPQGRGAPAPTPDPGLTDATPPPPQAKPTAAPPLAHPRRPRSILTRGTLAFGLIAGGVAALVDTAGVLDLTFEHYLALALTVVGVGLLVGAWWGRSATLLVLGALLVPPLLTASLVDVPLNGGEVNVRPRAWHQLGSEYQLGAGELTLDLTELDPSQGSAELEASVGMGELNVIVPSGEAVRAEGRVGAGSVDLLGEERGGFGVDLVREVGEGPPRLRLLLDVGVGEVIVRSSPR